MGEKCCKNKSMEIKTPYPKKRNKIEMFLDRYNHIMEFTRTCIQIMVFILQLIILYRLSN